MRDEEGKVRDEGVIIIIIKIFIFPRPVSIHTV